jgi:CheY-like chemotaxis protein
MSLGAVTSEGVTKRQSTSTRTVLIVEDEPDIRESLREVLEDEGYAVAVAANGKEGLAQLARLPKPCAVVLDIIMPVMSGNELYNAMQADPALAAIPVLVSTSDPTRAPSGVLIMKKPIDVDRFLDAVARLF